jgi:hypothetical protein
MIRVKVSISKVQFAFGRVRTLRLLRAAILVLYVETVVEVDKMDFPSSTKDRAA